MSRDEDNLRGILAAEAGKLRGILAAEAGKVDVEARALAEIRQKIDARRRRWWRPQRASAMFATTALALTAGVAAAVVGIASCVPQISRPAPGPADSAPAPTAIGPSLPVYFVGATSGGPRLYREFHPVPVGDASPAARTRAAVTVMLERRAVDPDYASPWPEQARVLDVRVADEVVTVDLGGADGDVPDVDAARAAVQQLVWTVTAASGKTGVRLLFDGQRIGSLWGQVPVGDELVRGNAVEVLAPVWLIDPQQGAVVGKTLRVRLDKDAPNQGAAEFNLTLAPGAYTIEAFYVSRDGAEQGLDDHAVTVR